MSYILQKPAVSQDVSSMQIAGLGTRDILTVYSIVCLVAQTHLLYAVLSCAGHRSNNFVVGLTNVSPVDSKPILWNYALCGQYLGKVPLGATVELQCRYNLPPFRYVVVQFPLTRILNVCEIQVMVKGMPEMLAMHSIILYSTGLVFQTPLV